MKLDQFDQNARVKKARELFDAGLDVPSQWVRDDVMRSWLRSREHGLSPVDQVLRKPLPLNDLPYLHDQHRDLLCYVESEMRNLFRSWGAAGWAFACLEGEGRSIKYFGKESVLGASLSSGLDLSEHVAGTNGPGCALLEHRPTVVCGDEHYLHEFRDLACVAVPIFDPAGMVIGALNATKQFGGSPVGILESVALASRAIENRMVEDLSGALVLAIHYLPELTGSPMRGLIHFCEDGEVLGANPTARQMLELEILEHNGRAVTFRDLFSCSLDDVRRSQRIPTKVACHNGSELFLKAEVVPEVSSSTLSRVELEPASVPLPFFAEASLRPLFEKARRAFMHRVPVLITGETGTGKEVLARWLHMQGPSSRGAFVAVNCSAIPAGLIESELFGYADGAFTGARRGGAKGKFEEACGGTLFLDEIGDMPVEFQARLLRVLQERTVTRLGEEKPRDVCFSLICATHRDLDELMEEGQFRDDLYYRLNGLQVTLPPLREREDLDGLMDHLLISASPDTPATLSPEARNLLRNYPWKGNVRELEQALKLGQALTDNGVIEVSHLPETVKQVRSVSVLARQAPETGSSLAIVEREAVCAAIEKCNGNISAAARELGITRATLYRKIKRFGI